MDFNTKFNGKIGVINGVRGIAILAVIWDHLFGGILNPLWVAARPSCDMPLFVFLPNGWLGVNLFFIVSGFVLNLPYEKNERKMGSSGDIKLFYKHRSLRLLPLFYFSVIFAMVFIAKLNFKEFLYSSLLMLTGIFSFTKSYFIPPMHGVLWSLGVEIWFSIIFPFLVIFSRRIGMKDLVLIAMAVGLTTRYLGTVFCWFDIGNPYLNPLKDGLFGRIDDFVIGMFIARLLCKRAHPMGQVKCGLLFFSGVFFVGLSCFLWNNVCMHHINRLLCPFINIFVDLGFALIIISLLFSEGGFLKSIFSSWPLQVIGMMSYSIYIWHGLIIRSIISGDPHKDIIPHNSIEVIYTLLAVFIISVLSYRFIEFGTEKDWRVLFRKS